MAIDLIAQGISYGSIIIATFLLNLRHMMMSASLSLDIKDIDRKYIPFIAFGITDESFSLVSFNKEEITPPFILTLFFSAHTVWWTGGIAGYLAGEFLPKSLQSSLGIGLYAMFAGLLFNQAKNDRKIIVLGILSMMIYFLIYRFTPISSGWDIIIGIILSSALGSYIFIKRGEKL